MWRAPDAALAARATACWRPDLRGFGWSDAPPDGDLRQGALADDVLALLDALGLERVKLVGHDWGGWAASCRAGGARALLEPAR